MSASNKLPFNAKILSTFDRAIEKKGYLSLESIITSQAKRKVKPIIPLIQKKRIIRTDIVKNAIEIQKIRKQRESEIELSRDENGKFNGSRYKEAA